MTAPIFTDLEYADLEYADLEYADLEYADLELRILEKQAQSYKVELGLNWEQKSARGFLAPNVLTFILITLLTALLLPSAALAAPSAQVPQTATVAVATLNIRAGPSVASALLGQAKRGDALPVIDRNGDAGFVVLPVPHTAPGPQHRAIDGDGSSTAPG